MNRYAYRIHDQGTPDGRAGMNPASEEILARLDAFGRAAPEHLRALGVELEIVEPPIRRGSGLRVVATAAMDWAEVSLAMSACAARHGLRATRIASAAVRSARLPLCAAATWGRIGALYSPAS
jgi:hypothetical protein